MRQEADRVRSFRRRGIVLGGAQLLLFGALGSRLYQLQVQNGPAYALLAEDNRSNQRLLVPPRGRILDRNGRPLAVNVPTYRIRIVREQAGDLRAMLEQLASIIALDPKRIEEFTARAAALPPFLPVMVRDDLTWEEVALIAVNSPDLPGLVLDTGLVREYPEGEVLAHVLGYIGPASEAEQAADPEPLLRMPEFRIGKSGIEQACDKLLRGRSGLWRFEVNALGREIRELEHREPQPGTEVELTLDLELQRFVTDRLSTELAASAVVLDIRSGGVRALASVPSFDPRVFTAGLSQVLWAELRTSPRTPLVNKCIQGQ